MVEVGPHSYANRYIGFCHNYQQENNHHNYFSAYNTQQDSDQDPSPIDLSQPSKYKNSQDENTEKKYEPKPGLDTKRHSHSILPYEVIMLTETPRHHYSPENIKETEASLDKAQKRKEQNKRAAMIYRSRQKSVSEMADQEYEQLEEKNKKLKEQLDSITQEIAYTRNMIELSVAATKQQMMIKQEQMETRSECVAAPLLSDFTPTKRPRNNSWPQTNNSNMAGLAGHERKKEQNKLASKRFRERKKQQMEQAKEHEKLLKFQNKKLKGKVTEIENNIQAMKILLQKNNVDINNI